MQFLANFLKPISQAYFEKIFAGHVFESYILPRIVTTDSRITIHLFYICRKNTSFMDAIN